jgi:hypothetical protein
VQEVLLFILFIIGYLTDAVSTASYACNIKLQGSKNVYDTLIRTGEEAITTYFKEPSQCLPGRN